MLGQGTLQDDKGLQVLAGGMRVEHNKHWSWSGPGGRSEEGPAGHGWAEGGWELPLCWAKVPGTGGSPAPSEAAWSVRLTAGVRGHQVGRQAWARPGFTQGPVSLLRLLSGPGPSSAPGTGWNLLPSPRQAALTAEHLGNSRAGHESWGRGEDQESPHKGPAGSPLAPRAPKSSALGPAEARGGAQGVSPHGHVQALQAAHVGQGPAPQLQRHLPPRERGSEPPVTRGVPAERWGLSEAGNAAGLSEWRGRRRQPRRRGGLRFLPHQPAHEHTLTGRAQH